MQNIAHTPRHLMSHAAGTTDFFRSGAEKTGPDLYSPSGRAILPAVIETQAGRTAVMKLDKQTEQAVALACERHLKLVLVQILLLKTL